MLSLKLVTKYGETAEKENHYQPQNTNQLQQKQKNAANKTQPPNPQALILRPVFNYQALINSL